MSIKRLNPYLNFNGAAERAIKLDESALGAKTEGLMRFGEAPGMDVAPEHRNWIIHAMLHIGEGIIMVSDTMPNMPVPSEGNVHVLLDFSDAAEMAKKIRGSRCRRQGHDAAAGHVLGREVRHADRRLRRALDVQLRDQKA